MPEFAMLCKQYLDYCQYQKNLNAEGIIMQEEVTNRTVTLR